MLDQYLNKVFHCHAQELLSMLPSESIDSVLADPMYMVAVNKGPNCTYRWGPEPGTGKAEEFWELHGPIYNECRRVLKPGGTLAWAMGCKHLAHFPDWFGRWRSADYPEWSDGFMIWGFSRFFQRGVNAFGHIWVVQTKEQVPIRFPFDHGLLSFPQSEFKTRRKFHPCPKNSWEMRFLVKHLSKPGDTILDCFAGAGSTLVAAKQLGRNYIGCDRDDYYVRCAKLGILQRGSC